MLTENPETGLFVSFGSNNPEVVILSIINIVLGMAGVIAILFLIYGGFQMITSGLNEDLAKRGKKTLTNAVIGLIIIILSYTIVSVVYKTITG